MLLVTDGFVDLELLHHKLALGGQVRRIEPEPAQSLLLLVVKSRRVSLVDRQADREANREANGRTLLALPVKKQTLTSPHTGHGPSSSVMESWSLSYVRLKSLLVLEEYTRLSCMGMSGERQFVMHSTMTWISVAYKHSLREFRPRFHTLRERERERERAYLWDRARAKGPAV